MTDDALVLHRLRVRYGKGGRLAYLGHLEVINTINRCIRRSGLPFSVGNGFARRIRIQFSQALPVGASSTCEYYDLMLTERVDEGQALERLSQATPTQLAPQAVGYLQRKVPALEAWAGRSRWEVGLVGEGLTAAELDAAIGEVRAQGELSYLRGDKPKRVDVGTTLVGWEVRPAGEGRLSLTLDTRSDNDGSLRPAVLLDAAFAQAPLAGATLAATRVCRTGLWHEAEDGTLQEPLG